MQPLNELNYNHCDQCNKFGICKEIGMMFICESCNKKHLDELQSHLNKKVTDYTLK